MMFKTHLAIGVFAAIIFWPIVDNQITFAVVVIIASLLPDIDTAFSKVGRNTPAKVVQVFTEHRGMLHSLTFLTFLTLIIGVFLPQLAFGFFLGWGVHLLADSFTKQGIAPFWPYSRVAKGMIKTNGTVEKGILFSFVLVDVLLIFVRLIG
jgi:inner membrane protein